MGPLTSEPENHDMPDAVARPHTLPHAAFLERGSLHPATSPAVRLGQGAFLVLRLIDLLAVDHAGRLAVVELKASADLHLPLQALDYWVRVKWHLHRGEFRACGYFPAIELAPAPPRLLLVSPSLDFHPTTETILGFFSPGVEVERIGLAVEWRKGLRVMFRLAGAQRPE